VKTLRLRDGDLVLGTSGYQMITGAPRVLQDLRCALGEPVGNDRFHPGYGSQLESYIGIPLDDDAIFLVVQEVSRVVRNYAEVQRDQITTDVLSGLTSRYTAGDVVAELTDIKVTASQDALMVTVAMRTLNAQDVVLSTSVGL
jgi:phage baseplate assembly protein W